MASGTILKSGAKLLWQGSWTGGTITVPETQRYNIFMIAMEGQGAVITVYRHPTKIYMRGIGGYPTGSNGGSLYGFAATLDSVTGEAWTLIYCGSGTAINALSTARTPTEIYGIV